MKSDFSLAFKQIIEDRGLPKEILIAAIEDAMVSAYRRTTHASNAQYIEAKIDSETGGVTIFAEKEVVEDVQDDRTEVELAKAKTVDADTAIGEMVIIETTPDDFGRVAAQTARQVIQQRIREAERDVQFDYYIKQVGDIVNGMVQSANARQVTLGLDMKAEGIMPRSQQIPREFFRVHDRVRALLLDIKKTNRGPKIILSRAHPDFLRRLLENEVPEVYHGMVEIKSIAREPGQRSKVAVAGLQPGVDAVGACVGIRGVRIQAIVRELNDEKIDVIEWSPDNESYIAKALSPARVLTVFLSEGKAGPNTATVVVPEDQLSLAIGRSGQNARLTAKLTGWRIDIKSLVEATSDVLFKLQNDPDYAEFSAQEKEIIPRIEAVMAKKAEGRPIMPEEYRELQSFTIRVENSVSEQRRETQRNHELLLEAAHEAVPKGAYDLPLLIMGFPTRINTLLEESGINSVGDLIFQMSFDAEDIEEIDGIGVKSIKKIEDAVELMTQIEPQFEDADVSDAPDELGVSAEPDISEEADEEPLTSTEEIIKPKSETPEPALEGKEITEEEQEDQSDKSGKYVDVEYDPDHDVMIYKKRHKREKEDWDKWEGELDDDSLDNV